MNTITSLHVILQIRVAALTEEKRSTYRMLLSLGHRTEQHIKRSNQAELLLMSSVSPEPIKFALFIGGFPLKRSEHRY